MTDIHQRTLFPQLKNQMPEDNAVTLLALSSVRGIGSATIRNLFALCAGDLTQFWTADTDNLAEQLRIAKTPHPAELLRNIQQRYKSLTAAARDYEKDLLQSRHTVVIFRNGAKYPKRLNDLSNPPAWLFVEGDVDLLNAPNLVAVVGTREPSATGLEAAKRLSLGLVRERCTIVSGLAEGIDAIGHRTAVDFGAPTVAVVGHGLDIYFPASTGGLRQEMVASGGAVISEYLLSENYSRDKFVQRNRIQSALSYLVGVVEGRSKSGTAHTVRYATELKRPLFGARLGAQTPSPTQELLHDLEQAGAPVFDLNSQVDWEALRQFICTTIPLEARKGWPAPQLYGNVMKQIEELAGWYDLGDEELRHLVKSIHRFRTKRNKARSNRSE